MNEWLNEQSKEWAEIYSRFGDSPPWRNAEQTQTALSILRDILSKQPGGRLLDYGCEFGDYVPLYLEHKFEVVGADIVPQVVEQCRASYASKGAEFYVAASPEELFQQLDREGKNTTFDVIVFWGTIHHIPPDIRPAFIDTFAKYLSSDGIFIVSGFSKDDRRFQGGSQGVTLVTKRTIWPIDADESQLNNDFCVEKRDFVPSPKGVIFSYFVCRRNLEQRFQKLLYDTLTKLITKISYVLVAKYQISDNLLHAELNRKNSTVFYRDKNEMERIGRGIFKRIKIFTKQKISLLNKIYIQERKQNIFFLFFSQSFIPGQQIPLRIEESNSSKKYIFGIENRNTNTESNSSKTENKKKFMSMTATEQFNLVDFDAHLGEITPKHDLNFKRDVLLPPTLTEDSEEYRICEMHYYGYRLNRELHCYYFINPVYSVNGREIGDGILSVVATNALTEIELEQINNVYLRWSAALSVGSFLVLKNQEAVKAAVAAIMSRNMSHNLGSHVITNTKHQVEDLERRQKDPSDKVQLKGLSALLQYLQERQDFIAVIANDEHYPRGPLNFKNDVFDVLAMDGPPKRHDVRERTNNYILDNIARSEGIARQDSISGIRTNLNIEIQLVKLDASGGAPRVLRSLGEPDIGNAFADLTLSVNYGLNGRQAFLTILENIIRNAAKHDRAVLANLENNTLVFSVIFRECADNRYEITICDNKRNFAGAKASLLEHGVISGDGRLAPLHILDQERGGLDKSNKGTKEILICLAWMKYGRSASGNEISYETLQNTPWNLMSVVGVDNATYEGHTWDSEATGRPLSLGYRFSLLKFKRVHLLSLEHLTEKAGHVWDRLNLLPGASIYAVRRGDLAAAQGDILKAIPRLVVVDDGQTEAALEAQLEGLYEQNIRERFGMRLGGGELPLLRVSDAESIRTARKDDPKVIREYDFHLDAAWGEQHPGRFVHYVHHLEDGPDIRERLKPGALFTEGISGGNHTNTLVRTDIDRFRYLAIVEAALTEIAIVDERLFEKYAGRLGRETAEKDRPTWHYLKHKRIHILNSDDRGVYDLWGHTAEPPVGGYDFLSVHLGLLGKTPGANSEEKIGWLFGPHCFSKRSKISIHSGRGGLAQVEDIAFIPLSGIEWALGNCKVVLSDFFHGLKYPPLKLLERAEAERGGREQVGGSKEQGVRSKEDVVGSKEEEAGRREQGGRQPASSARQVFIVTTSSLGEFSLAAKATGRIPFGDWTPFTTQEAITQGAGRFADRFDSIAHIDHTVFFYPCARFAQGEVVPAERFNDYIAHFAGVVLDAVRREGAGPVDLHLVLHAGDGAGQAEKNTLDTEHPLIGKLRQCHGNKAASVRIWWFSHDNTGIHKHIVKDGAFFDGGGDKAAKLLGALAKYANAKPLALARPGAGHAVTEYETHIEWRIGADFQLNNERYLTRLAAWQLSGAADKDELGRCFDGSELADNFWGRDFSPRDATRRIRNPKPLLIIGARPLHDFGGEERRFNYLDSSIWCRYADTDEAAEDVRRQFRAYAKLGLYRSNVGKEHLEYHARSCANSRFGKFEESGHSQIVPVVFHSEGEIQDKMRGYLERLKEYSVNRPLTWKILLADDHVETALSGGSTMPGSVCSKLDVIRDTLATMFHVTVHKADDREESFGERDNSLNIDLHYVGTLDETMARIKGGRFDLILLDYLFTTPSASHGRNWNDFKTSDMLLHDLKEVNKEILGPFGSLWIFNASAFEEALNSKLKSQGLSYFMPNHWHIDRGACAVNTPELFKHNLLAFILHQLEVLTEIHTQRDIPKDTLRIITLLDLLEAIFTPKNNRVREQAARHFIDLLNFKSDYDVLRGDLVFTLPDGAGAKPETIRSNAGKSEIVYALFPDIAHYNDAFWEHLINLVRLIAYGSPQQWPEILIHFKETKETLRRAAGGDGQGKARAESLLQAIEDFIVGLYNGKGAR